MVFQLTSPSAGDVGADHFKMERHALFDDPLISAVLPSPLEQQVSLTRDGLQPNGKVGSASVANETAPSGADASNHSSSSSHSGSDPGSPPGSSHGEGDSTSDTADAQAPRQRMSDMDHSSSSGGHGDSHSSGGSHSHSECGRGSGDGHPHRTLKLGAARRHAFLTSVKNDTAWLEQHDIMDYSLLLGVGVCPRSKIEAQRKERAARLEQRRILNEHNQAADALAVTFAEDVAATVAYENRR